jgi:anaerobic dimethyl sulfoxide reductase subunit B
MQRLFIFDTARCFGCNGCTAACANANETPGGVLWRTVHKLPPHEGDHRTVYLSVSCNHCENPPCVRGCPANALEKRESDGVVIHHKEKCLGCRYCQMACPYDAIKWHEEAGVVGKCHFCYERLDEGREPACVETCFGGALRTRLAGTDELKELTEKESPGMIYIKAVLPAIRFDGIETAPGTNQKLTTDKKPFPPEIPPVLDDNI